MLRTFLAASAVTLASALALAPAAAATPMIPSVPPAAFSAHQDVRPCPPGHHGPHHHRHHHHRHPRSGSYGS
jgi:Spy/CpxP family protein refolding chaperone